MQALAHALQRFVLDPHYAAQANPQAVPYWKAQELQIRVNATKRSYTRPGPPDWHAIARLCEAGEAFLTALPPGHPIRAVLDVECVRRVRAFALSETS